MASGLRRNGLAHARPTACPRTSLWEAANEPQAELVLEPRGKHRRAGSFCSSRAVHTANFRLDAPTRSSLLKALHQAARRFAKADAQVQRHAALCRLACQSLQRGGECRPRLVVGEVCFSG